LIKGDLVKSLSLIRSQLAARQNKFVVVLLILGLLLTIVGVNLLPKTTQEVYVGIDIGYGDETTVFRIVNQVCDYVNLIVLGSLQVTSNTTKLTSVCDYLFQKDISFIVFVAYAKMGSLPPQGPGPQFFQMASQRWGSRFLGAYIFDEPGGKQMDYNLSNPSKPVSAASNYTDAAEKYVYIINDALVNITGYYKPAHLKLFTSDYALYWFDYAAGYDVVFGEFGSSQGGPGSSRAITMALCRGAARAQNKDWGTIITWVTPNPPYLEDANLLYKDMVTAYQNGAKYIVVFDSPGNNTELTQYGILTNQQLYSIQRFWNYEKMGNHPTEFPAENAYVLPKDYGFGFRMPSDYIWGQGLWGPDELTPKIWNDTNSLVIPNNLKFDITFETKFDDTPIIPPYKNLIFWNGTTTER
jgi:hypothetical protein